MSHDKEHTTDVDSFQSGYLFGNDYALPYLSRWSDIHDGHKELLMHMNCGYLSTHGAPPTLLALKQHAQSLAILIAMLSPSLLPGEINADGAGENEGAQRFELNGSFDWLNDLNQPYTNDDPAHHLPLNALVNEVKSKHDVLGTEYHCPLAEVDKPRLPGQARKPYANHHNLIMHTNECLERLDHEFSATGGLLSMLPEDGDGHSADEVTASRNSLLGQWLTFTGHLVSRMHELEIQVANCLDTLASEAVVPMQHLSMAGPDARSTGREIAYPQDKWVLVNAGDDVFTHIHDMLDKREALIEEKAKIWKSGGVGGERMWMEERGGRTYARGIVPINVVTRYYRLQGTGRNTLFVVPAWEHHPAVEYTRELEGKPTVVSVVQPKFPVRATEFEARYTARLEELSKLEQKNTKLEMENLRQKDDLYVLEQQVEREQNINDFLLDRSFEEDGEQRSASRSQEKTARGLAEELRDTKKRLLQLEAELHAATEKHKTQEEEIVQYRNAMWDSGNEVERLEDAIRDKGFEMTDKGLVLMVDAPAAT